MEEERSNICADEVIHSAYDPQTWPPLRGDYRVTDPLFGVAVVTLASHIEVAGAAIVGPCKTENLGVEKVVANLISNSCIRFLLICGAESRGHLPGDAILALHKNGIDEEGHIVGSKGAIPFIENLPSEAISRFQCQIEVVDRIGLEDEKEINRIVEGLRRRASPYPEPPLEVVKKRVAAPILGATRGDLLFGCGVFLDASAWQVAKGGE